MTIALHSRSHLGCQNKFEINQFKNYKICFQVHFYASHPKDYEQVAYKRLLWIRAWSENLSFAFSSFQFSVMTLMVGIILINETATDNIWCCSADTFGLVHPAYPNCKKYVNTIGQVISIETPRNIRTIILTNANCGITRVYL